MMHCGMANVTTEICKQVAMFFVMKCNAMFETLAGHYDLQMWDPVSSAVGFYNWAGWVSWLFAVVMLVTSM
jgi:hypothetical protein